VRDPLTIADIPDAHVAQEFKDGLPRACDRNCSIVSPTVFILAADRRPKHFSETRR
jgi:hypothetical protein